MSQRQVAAALASAQDEVGPALLELAEDQWFDRKSARIRPEELAKTEVAFGNAEGGVIVVGLSNGVVEGTDRDPARRNALMQAAADFTEPPVHARPRLVPCRTADGDDHLLVIEVETGQSVHTNHRDEVYLRVGDETRKMSFAQRQELTFDKGQSNFEIRPVEGTDLGDVRKKLLKNYAGLFGTVDPERLLRARGLAVSGQLTVAGLLLFGDDPQRVFPEAFVRVLRYRGRLRGSGADQQLIADQRFDGPLPYQVQEAAKSIQRLQPERQALTSGGAFGSVPLIPPGVWREALVNAVVHRSYSVTGDHIRVEIFDDRIEVASPGRFPGLVSLSDPLDVSRFARNPRIARVCSDLKIAQEIGEGIRRMFEEMRQAGLEDPVYRQTSGGVRVTLPTELADRELDARLPPDARLVTTSLREAGRLGTGEIGQLLGLSRPAVVRRLATLQDLGLIEWVGKSPKDPRAYWRLPGGYSQPT